jgi:nucleotide-binding universal stress UspA family protein
VRILLAVDGSPSSDRARDLVASLAWGADSVVRVVAALDIGPALWGGPWIPAVPADADEYEAQALADLTRVVRETREQLSAVGLGTEGDVVRGSPALAIADDSRAWKPDLTVVGSRGHGPIESALLGSVSAAVVDHSDQPVLVARGDHFRSILLAEDGSAAGMAARDVVLRWPAFAAVPVRVLGVVDVAAPWRTGIAPTMFSAAMDLYSEMLANSRTTFSQVVSATVAAFHASGRSAEGELREGDPAAQICEAVHDAGGDLLVIGSRGHRGISRIVMGSVAHSVLLHARCSVLIVKRPPGEH